MTPILADVPTIGLFAGWIFAGIAVLIFALAIAGGVAARRARTAFGREDASVYAIGATATAVVCGVITLWAMWPLKYEYHHYVTKTGQVSTIDKRLVGVGSENGASERYVIRTPGGDTFGVDDTRAGALRTGDEFAIKCKREHQWFQRYEQDGWACRWGS